MPGSTFWEYNGGDWDGYLGGTAFINILRELTFSINERWWLVDGYLTTGPGSSDDAGFGRDGSWNQIGLGDGFKPMGIGSRGSTSLAFYPGTSDCEYLPTALAQGFKDFTVKSYGSIPTETVSAALFRMQEAIDAMIPSAVDSAFGLPNPGSTEAGTIASPGHFGNIIWKRTTGTTDYKSSTDYYNNSDELLAAGSYGTGWLSIIQSGANRFLKIITWEEVGDVTRQIQEAIDNLRMYMYFPSGMPNFDEKYAAWSTDSVNYTTQQPLREWVQVVNAASSYVFLSCGTGYGGFWLVHGTGGSSMAITRAGSTWHGGITTTGAGSPNDPPLVPNNEWRGVHFYEGLKTIWSTATNLPSGDSAGAINNLSINWNWTQAIGTPLITRFKFAGRVNLVQSTEITATFTPSTASTDADYEVDFIGASTVTLYTHEITAWPLSAVLNAEEFSDLTTSMQSILTLSGLSTDLFSTAGSGARTRQAFFCPRLYANGVNLDIGGFNPSSQDYGDDEYRALGMGEYIGINSSSTQSGAAPGLRLPPICSTHFYDYTHIIADIHPGLTYG